MPLLRWYATLFCCPEDSCELCSAHSSFLRSWEEELQFRQVLWVGRPTLQPQLIQLNDVECTGSLCIPFLFIILQYIELPLLPYEFLNCSSCTYLDLDIISGTYWNHHTIVIGIPRTHRLREVQRCHPVLRQSSVTCWERFAATFAIKTNESMNISSNMDAIA